MADDRNPRGYRAEPYGRSATPAGQASDPLAELARLIGQPDPFNSDPRTAQSDPRAPQAPWPDSRLGRDPRAAQGGYGAAPAPNPEAYRRSDGGDPRVAPDHVDPRQGHDDRRYLDPRHTDPGYADPRYADPRYADPRNARYADPHYADPRGYNDAHGNGDERDAYPRHVLNDAHFPQDRPFSADGRGYDQTRLSDYDPDQLGDEHDYEGDEAAHDDVDEEAEEHAAPRRSRLATVLAVVGLALVGTAAAVGYRAVVGGRSGPAPVIRADNTPNKVVPAQNGDAVANKQIYDRLADRGQDEHVVPREEQPVDIRDTARSATPQMVAPTLGAPAPAGPAPAPQHSTAGFAPASANATQEPRRIRTVTIRPDEGTDVSTRAAARPGSPPMTVVAPAAAGPSAHQTPRATDSGGPLSLTPDVASPAPAAMPARTRTAAAMPTTAAVSHAAPGLGYVVQVLAQSSEAEAESSFRSMQARYPNQLGGLQPIIRRKELSSGVKYGAQVGPYASREQALKLCEDLKAAGGSCFVAKN